MTRKNPIKTTIRRRPVLAAWTLAAGACCAALGCGDGGPSRFHVSGTATYNGQPIPAGAVLLTPDVRQGGRGAAGFARIVNGNYDTQDHGAGVEPGPYVATVSGFDGQPIDDLPDGRPLFEERTETIVVEPRRNTFHFDLSY